MRSRNQLLLDGAFGYLIVITIVIVIGVCKTFGTPPSPQGLVIDWWKLVPLSYSNYAFFVWSKAPGVATWQNLTMTSETSYTNSTAGPAGTLFGVTALGRSNLIYVSLDLGIAPWWPDLAVTNAVNLTPVGPWTVPTNTWLRKSTDLRNFTQRERFHYGSNGTVLVDHYEHPAEPYLFFSIAPLATPPAPGGAP